MPPPNDDFATAELIAGSSGTTTGTNVAATVEVGEPAAFAGTGDVTIWYAWTAADDGVEQFDTTGSAIDTVIDVFTGVSLAGLTLVGGNDDSVTARTSLLQIPVTAGTTYWIRVNGYDHSEQGDIVLNWTPYFASWLAVGTLSWPTSVDAATWDGQTVAFSVGNGVAWDGTQWVATGQNGAGTQTVATSPDGITWTVQTSPFDDGGNGNGVAGNGSLWVVVGQNTDNSKTIITSPDGISWTHQPSPFDTTPGNGYAAAVAWNGSLWVAVGASFLGVSGQSIVATSPDGVTWTLQVTPWDLSGGFGLGVTWDGTQWVVVGRGDGTGGTLLMTSPDGITWTSQSSPFDNTGAGTALMNGVASDGAGNLVAVGKTAASSRALMSSADGITWAAITESSGWTEAFGVAYGDGHWVAVGSNALILTSPDAATWTVETSEMGRGQAVAWAQAPVVAVGSWSIGSLRVG